MSLKIFWHEKSTIIWLYVRLRIYDLYVLYKKYNNVILFMPNKQPSENKSWNLFELTTRLAKEKVPIRAQEWHLYKREIFINSAVSLSLFCQSWTLAVLQFFFSFLNFGSELEEVFFYWVNLTMEVGQFSDLAQKLVSFVILALKNVLKTADLQYPNFDFSRPLAALAGCNQLPDSPIRSRPPRCLSSTGSGGWRHQGKLSFCNRAELGTCGIFSIIKNDIFAFFIKLIWLGGRLFK